MYNSEDSSTNGYYSEYFYDNREMLIKYVESCLYDFEGVKRDNGIPVFHIEQLGRLVHITPQVKCISYPALPRPFVYPSSCINIDEILAKAKIMYPSRRYAQKYDQVPHRISMY